MTERKLRVGVIGAGHFGRFHVLKSAIGPREHLVGLVDPDATRAASVAAEGNCPVLTLDALFAASEAVIIASPADTHHAMAKAAMLAGRHVLIEKPIASTLAEADELAALAQSTGLVLQVGHLERFSAAYEAVAAHITKPLYIEATRIAPFKPRGTDVSVILDLMIHDLDLILALVDSKLIDVDAVGAPVASAHEDIANARLRFENGCVATITASRISLKLERRMRVFAHAGYLAVDFVNRELNTIGAGPGLPVPGVPGFAVNKKSWQDHDNLAAEHEAFAASVLDGAPVLVDAAAGRRALSAAIAVARAMDASRARMLASGLLERAISVE